jgi:hypothetical protein
VQKRGWVELTCYGGPLMTQRGIEVGALTTFRLACHTRELGMVYCSSGSDHALLTRLGQLHLLRTLGWWGAVCNAICGNAWCAVWVADHASRSSELVNRNALPPLLPTLLHPSRIDPGDCCCCCCCCCRRS